MAASEAQFQTEMVESTRAAGGTCWKMKSLSQNGIPDLHILLPEMTGWIECKFWDAYKERGKYNKKTFEKDYKSQMNWALKTTAKQKERIWELHKGESIAGWAVCVKDSNSQWSVYVGVHEDKKFGLKDFCSVRKSGEDWPVLEMLKCISLAQKGYPLPSF